MIIFKFIVALLALSILLTGVFDMKKRKSVDASDVLSIIFLLSVIIFCIFS